MQLKGVKEASQGIVVSIQQMATAIQDEAASVYKINESMTQSLQGVNQTVEISKGIVVKSGLNVYLYGTNLIINLLFGCHKSIDYIT